MYLKFGLFLSFLTCVLSQDEQQCVCVPYYLCDPATNQTRTDGETDGWGLIDIRFGNECSGSVDICCGLPRSTDNPIVIPPVTQTGCGIRNTGGRDFQLVSNNVNDAGIYEFPWVIAILGSTNNLICAGSLIHPQVVLTAAHCVDKTQASNLKARGGEWDTQTTNERLPHQEKRVRTVILHPQFASGTLVKDVALLVLAEPFTIGDNINTVCLAQNGENLNNAQQCIASGWGKRNFAQPGRFSVILKKVTLDVVNSQTCQQQLRKTRVGPRYKLDSSFICAGGLKDVDTCDGDGGAPLACPGANNRYKQAGIVSWGVDCGVQSVPGVYTSIPNVRSWIDEEMRKAGFGSTSYTMA